MSLARANLSVGNHVRTVLNSFVTASPDKLLIFARQTWLLIEDGTCCQIAVLKSGTKASKERDMLKSVFLAAMIATFAVGAAMAQETCESKAVGKDGKALAGAAKTSFMKKCMADSCATKAVSADGKPLAGAAKNSFMKKCEKGA
jgi:hypothetical protein